ncbi:hydrophobic/amphiphilic exporter-1, HAE1 family [Methylobacillus rhizosphaerae]|uniref:Hydrophobic/amphiphilic exporter-1, HAE1 family n=1 Tax=Methylobacillus rhizosphaerae TaxID=551994 RepID=A0A238Z6A6_9PROT|nr:efflux RND transporter permease subunit [Methylobacillus rhizosphaerae]SNR78692.1 hydrophobic/amphiphilic exporter-1, HAE1 family [Methylobacillus rhizosphaerae]
MTLPELSIKRHVLAWMVSGLLVLLGIISYQRIGVDRLPYIEFPVISITTTLDGANPDIVDASITSIIETSVNTTPGIEHIQSSSSPGVSVITLTFDLEKNIDIAYNEVQSKVNQVLRRLPDDAEPPQVRKVETNAQPIMWLALRGDRTAQQLNLYGFNVLKKKLETINGIGEVRLGGRQDRTIRVNVLPDRMASYNLTATDLIDAFKREHIQLPGGFLVGHNSEYLMKLDLEFHHLRDMREMVVAYRDDAPIKLKDVAELEDDIADYRQLARYMGKPSVGLGIVKVSNANTVAIIDEVLHKLDTEIRPNLPPGMTLDISTNDALFIEEIVGALQEHLFEGTLLAALIVWLFLRSIRSTLIIATAIPVSLLGSVAVMYFSGFTFNTMTLLALLLLIGVVVDDAIVVLENIYRHLSMQKRTDIPSQTIARNAAINGSREVAFAVIAATFSLVCIFAPVIFMDGIIGKFFKSFAVVVTFGVLVSLLVSLTLTPMLCSRYLKAHEPAGHFYHWLDRIFHAMDHLYARILAWTLNHRWKVMLLTVLVVVTSIFFFGKVQKEFIPDSDEGRFMISFRTPLGSNIEYTNSRMERIESILQRHDDQIASYFGVIGVGAQGQVNKGTVSIRLHDRRNRSMSQQALIRVIRSELDQIPGVRAFPVPVAIVGGQRSEKLQFNITGPNLEQVSQLGKNMQQKLAEIPGIGKVDLDLDLDLPQLTMQIDRVRAASLGLSALEIASALNLYTGGIDIADFNDEPGDGQRYEIRLKAKEGSLQHPEDLKKIYLRSGTGELVRLDSVASFKQTLGAAVIGRFDLQYAASLYANPTISLGDAVQQVNQLSSEMLPPGYQFNLTGQAEELEKTVSNMIFAFSLAMILLYMVLASQFNSFLQPFIIMLAQPLAIIGGVFALWVTGNSLNIFSMIGLVLLIGLVAKNSILLIDLTNQLRDEGKDIHHALLEACPVRLRPVLMTSLTIILALLPAAFGLGAGAETNGPLSIAVIGGMISSTLLTLVVVPAAYSLLMHAVRQQQS